MATVVAALFAIFPWRKKLPAATSPTDEDCATPEGAMAVAQGRHTQRALQMFGKVSEETIVEMGDLQVGGHKDSLSMKLLRPHFVLKPLQSDSRGQREIKFYEELEHLRSLNLSRMLRFICEYHGVLPNVKSTGYLVLTDVTAHYRRPCVMDCKIGQQTFEAGATASKIKKEIDKYPRQAEAGFRFVGTRVYSADGYMITSKKHFLKLGPEDAPEVFTGYLSALTGRLLLRTMDHFLSNLDELICCFEQETRFTFTSSSLLFVYDAHPEESGLNLNADLKLIDFAHVNCAKGVVDMSSLYGLRRVRAALFESSKTIRRLSAT
jgi:hypothetical protein